MSEEEDRIKAHTAKGVLSSCLYTPDEIAEINVPATMTNGRIVHEEAVDRDPQGD